MAPNSPVVDSSMQQSLNGFSTNIYQSIATTTPGNLFVSPLSIASVLFLAYAGAKGSTQNEIGQALRLQSGKDQQVLDSFGNVISIFNVPMNSPYNFSLANRAYVEKSAKIKQSYTSTIFSKLRSTVGVVDFLHNASGAAKAINQWVEQQTNSKIQNLITEDSVGPSTLMILVNAIYFKASWEEKFAESLTKKEDFTALDGSKSKVKMMSMFGERYNYFDNLDGSKNGLPPFHALSIPYKDKDLSLLVLLPKDNKGLTALEKALKTDSFKVIKEGSEDRGANLYLPKFKVEQNLDLIATLKKLGIQQLFGREADLSGIADGQLTVSKVVHKAFIDVDEKGTEAAAATGMQIMLTSHMVVSDDRPTVEFRVDHPFLFAIRHEKSGLIVFMGRITKI